MDDISAFFRSGFQSLQQKALDMNYQKKSVQDRISDARNLRRQTRTNILLQKRNIDENNLTPFGTPQVRERESSLKPKPAVNIKRLEMLRNWKEAKEKRKQQEQKNAKPVFKVCHVTHAVGCSDLEHVNKEIKGKPIKGIKSFTSRFAPENHEFRPPKNVHLINTKLGIKNVGGISANTKKSRVPDKKEKKVDSVKTPTINRTMETRSQRQARVKIVDSKGQNSTTANFVAVKKTTGPKLMKATNNARIAETSPVKKPVKAAAEKKNALGIKKVKESSQIYQQSSTNSSVSFSDLKRGSVSKNPRNSSENQDKESPQQHKESRNEGNNLSSGKLRHKSSNSDNPPNSNESSSKVTRRRRRSRMNNFEENPDKDSETEKMPNKEDVNKLRRISASDRKRRSIRSKVARMSASFDEALFEKPIKSLDGGAFEDVSFDSKKSEYTPKKDAGLNVPNYVSPFVTISRGKDSARKEFTIRQSNGGVLPVSLDYGIDLGSSTSPQAGADYFEKKLDSEIGRIRELCKQWTECRENDTPEDFKDSIDVAVGQSNLLISKKFKQFRDLIAQCRNCQYKEKPVTCTDLHGYWDTMYMQVEDIDKRFDNLKRLRANNWEEVVPDIKLTKRGGKGGKTKKINASSKIRDMIRLARSQNRGGAVNPTEANVMLLSTPVDGNERRSLRKSLLSSTVGRGSPGLTMMKVSQIMKSDSGITPSKSILKTEPSKSAKRGTKSVLFKDLDRIVDDTKSHSYIAKQDDKENNAGNLNLICFSPLTPVRRSTRLHLLQ